MFDIPSSPEIKKCRITKETITSNVGPKVVVDEEEMNNRYSIKKTRQTPQNAKKETA